MYLSVRLYPCRRLRRHYGEVVDMVSYKILPYKISHTKPRILTVYVKEEESRSKYHSRYAVSLTSEKVTISFHNHHFFRDEKQNLCKTTLGWSCAIFWAYDINQDLSHPQFNAIWKNLNRPVGN